MQNENKNKSTLILMIVVFVLPVVLAYMALKFDWFNKASTNRGELLQPTIEALNLLSQSESKWHLLYIIPSDCDASCENAIYSVGQIFLATGKESDRVEKLFIATESSSAQAIKSVENNHGAFLLRKSDENVNDA